MGQLTEIGRRLPASALRSVLAGRRRGTQGIRRVVRLSLGLGSASRGTASAARTRRRNRWSRGQKYIGTDLVERAFQLVRLSARMTFSPS